MLIMIIINYWSFKRTGTDTRTYKHTQEHTQARMCAQAYPHVQTLFAQHSLSFPISFDPRHCLCRCRRLNVGLAENDW